MRLIDADAFIEQLKADIEEMHVPEFIEAAQALTIDIAERPTVDAVEVVRCKDCKWWKTNYMWNGSERKVCVIETYEPVRNEGDYCSRGERRENETH